MEDRGGSYQSGLSTIKGSTLLFNELLSSLTMSGSKKSGKADFRSILLYSIYFDILRNEKFKVSLSAPVSLFVS